MSKAVVVVVVKGLTFEQAEMVSTRSSSTHSFSFLIETDDIFLDIVRLKFSFYFGNIHTFDTLIFLIFIF